MPEMTATPTVEAGTPASDTTATETDAVDSGTTLTDEELVGLEPDAYRAEYKEAADQKTEEAEPIATTEGSKPSTEEEGIATSQPLPDSFKKAIAANPEIKAELQRLWDQHQAFREVFPTVAEARAVKELFPGGSEDAKTALVKAREMEESDQLFLSRDPQAHRDLAANMLQMDPHAFSAMLQVSADLVRERQPELYHAFASGMAHQVLTGEGFPQHVRGLIQAIENGDLNSAHQLASQLSVWAQDNGLLGGQRAAAGAAPRAAASSPREEKLQHELNSLTWQQGSTFTESVNRTVVPQIGAEIRKLIEPVAKGLPGYAREGAMQSLAQQIHAGIAQRLNSDHYYISQIVPIQMSMNYGPQNREAAVKIVVSRALLHLKPVAKQVLQAWTPRQIEHGRQSAEKADSAARRTDINGGGLTHGRPRTKLTQDEARDMSDDQLIDWALKR